MQNDTAHKDIHCSFICYGKSLEIIQTSSNKGWLNKLCCSHAMESPRCSLENKMKQNEEHLLVVIWKDFQERLSEKKKWYREVVYSFYVSKEAKKEYTYTYILNLHMFA